MNTLGKLGSLLVSQDMDMPFTLRVPNLAALAIGARELALVTKPAIAAHRDVSVTSSRQAIRTKALPA